MPRSRVHRKSARVEGVIFGRVKGGFTVDLDGAVAFLPGSQVDIRPVRDVTPPSWTSRSPSRSSRWIAVVATSSFRVAPSSKKPAPNSVRA
ncbi:MAG: S1 RNA-binding domain-containing protein [Rhodoferax sp.]|nr:S1 RNA-binding domain-containing protein [Rhodoferax sp.]